MRDILQDCNRNKFQDEEFTVFRNLKGISCFRKIRLVHNEKLLLCFISLENKLTLV